MGSARSAPLPAGPIKPQLADLLCNRLRDGTHHKYEQRMNFPLNKAPERALHCLLEDRWGPNSSRFFDLLCDFPVAALGVTHSRQDLWPLCACPHCGHSRLLTTTSAPCMQSLMSFTACPIISIPSKILQKSNFTDGETVALMGEVSCTELCSGWCETEIKTPGPAPSTVKGQKIEWKLSIFNTETLLKFSVCKSLRFQ